MPCPVSEISPRLELGEQTGLETEDYLSHGQRTRLHYVIKNHWFQVDVRLCSDNANNNVDFRSASVHAKLVYDTAEEREVTMLRTDPLEYKGVVDSTDPTRCRVDARISALSTQHEDMNFRLLIELVDTQSKKVMPGVRVRSEPIQVISKPAVLKGKYGPNRAQLKGKSKSVGVGKKRQRTEAGGDEMIATLNTIAAENRETLELLRRIESSAAERSMALMAGGTEGSDERFRHLFTMLVREYVSTPVDERPSKLQRTMATVEIGHAHEFVSHLHSAVEQEAAMRFTTVADDMVDNFADLFRLGEYPPA